MQVTQPLFALVDCNNFYASCEKLFRPDIKDRPVVVLSNNDGCIVARSAEAKALGIKMGVPAFKIRELIEREAVLVFSSNYALYADMSDRVMRTLEELAPRVEIYSIDEAFLDLSGAKNLMELTNFGKQVKQCIQQRTGMAVCVGIAPTKTLAKLANFAAKHYKATGGVLDLTAKSRQRKLMAITPVEEVWGVGARLSESLKSLGIQTALALADADPKQIRQQFSVVLERIVRELNGESCLEFEPEAAPKQQILCSRSFGDSVSDKTRMKQLISGYVARAGEKLRAEYQCCGHLQVFIRTSFFRKDTATYSNAASTRLVSKTSDTRVLNRAAMGLLDRIWQDDIAYAKAGVMLSDLTPGTAGQADLFEQRDLVAGDKLMRLIDSINAAGHGTAWLASQGRQSPWTMKRAHLSPAYTTRWDDLPVIRR